MEINKYIDHTNLKVGATLRDIEQLCQEAIDNNFASVCIHPYYVNLAVALLKNTNIAVGTVVGFPLGMNTTATKVYEAIEAIEAGAEEIDMVINISALKNQDYEYVKNEIEEMRDAIEGKVLKAIIETSLLTTAEIVKMTHICNETYVNFIKTSTGFNGEGATVENVNLINQERNEVLEIKASGGIKTFNQVTALIEAGATRIGTSNSINIITKKDQ